MTNAGSNRRDFTCGYDLPSAVSTWLSAWLPRSPARFATASFSRSTSTRASSALRRCVNSSRSGAADCVTISGSPVLVTLTITSCEI